MESVKVSEIDDYLEAVLSKYGKRYTTGGINFMETTPRSCNIRL